MPSYVAEGTQPSVLGSPSRTPLRLMLVFTPTAHDTGVATAPLPVVLALLFLMILSNSTRSPAVRAMLPACHVYLTYTMMLKCCNAYCHERPDCLIVLVLYRVLSLDKLMRHSTSHKSLTNSVSGDLVGLQPIREVVAANGGPQAEQALG